MQRRSQHSSVCTSPGMRRRSLRWPSYTSPGRRRRLRRLLPPLESGNGESGWCSFQLTAGFADGGGEHGAAEAGGDEEDFSELHSDDYRIFRMGV